MLLQPFGILCYKLVFPIRLSKLSFFIISNQDWLQVSAAKLLEYYSSNIDIQDAN